MLQAVSAVQDGSSPSSEPGVLDLAPPPSPVLRIIIDNMFYPVTLDVLQQVHLFISSIQVAMTADLVQYPDALLSYSVFIYYNNCLGISTLTS